MINNDHDTMSAPYIQPIIIPSDNNYHNYNNYNNYHNYQSPLITTTNGSVIAVEDIENNIDQPFVKYKMSNKVKFINSMMFVIFLVGIFLMVYAWKKEKIYNSKFSTEGLILFYIGLFTEFIVFLYSLFVCANPTTHMTCFICYT